MPSSGRHGQSELGPVARYWAISVLAVFIGFGVVLNSQVRCGPDSWVLVALIAGVIGACGVLFFGTALLILGSGELFRSVRRWRGPKSG